MSRAYPLGQIVFFKTRGYGTEPTVDALVAGPALRCYGAARGRCCMRQSLAGDLRRGRLGERRAFLRASGSRVG